MTREQFLNELKAALAAMETEEKEAVLAYYAEMIDDRIEAGMSEEAAVMAMEPVREIAARVLEEAGIEEQPAREQAAADSDAKEIVRAAADVRELIVRAECKKITIVSGDTEEVKLRYNIGSNDIFELHDNDGVISLEHKIRPFSSFINEQKTGTEGMTLDSILSSAAKFLGNLGERIVQVGSNFLSEGFDNDIEITLPQTFVGRLHAGTSNARITVEDVNFSQPLVLTTSNSRITLDEVKCLGGLTATTSNARITLNDVHAASLHLTTSNGGVNLEDVIAVAEIEAATRNGAIDVNDTECGGMLRLSTSNAHVELEDVAAPSIAIRTSNASVSGSIRGTREEYTITSTTSNGSNRLGSSIGGDKTLNVTTSNGSITLGFEE
ncbi:MAG: DUF4097 family beta strand repeat protein [Clostridia bacterium]|nr:DUF4097 family beta strand repeat protein [Clostridia bacterium]